MDAPSSDPLAETATARHPSAATVVTSDVAVAADFIRRGWPVAFPTETVFGLGASVYDEVAIRRIYEAKGRPSSNPLIAHVVDPDEIRKLAASIPDTAQRLIEVFFPGPLTIVLKRAEDVPDVATAGLATIAVRMPDHPIASELIRAVGTPLVAPSANRSGRPSPTTWEAVREDLDGRIACILIGERSRSGLESTVIDCSDDVPVLLRPGSISIDALRRIIPSIRTSEPGDQALARSPGTRFRHYAPDAELVLVTSSREAVPSRDAAYIGLDAPEDPAQFGLARVCRDEAEYAYEIFDFLRECDRAGAVRVFCQKPQPSGIGLALLDRLQRAADRA